MLLFFLIVLTRAYFHAPFQYHNGLPNVQMEIGFPKQTQTVIIDTQSQGLLIPCKKQDQNTNQKLPFNIEQSRTSELFKCEPYDLTCLDCQKGLCKLNFIFWKGRQLKGFMFKDGVSLGNSLPIYNFTMGCIDDDKANNFNKQNTGILGLTHTDRQTYDINLKYKLKMEIIPNVFDEITDAENNSLSICFDQEDPYMSIGILRKTTWIPYYDDNYRIKILEITSKNFHINTKQLKKVEVLLDTGSNLNQIGDWQIYKQFVNHIQSQGKSEFKYFTQNELYCVYYNGSLKEFDDGFPQYIFKLENGLIFTWEPRNYIIRFQEYQCLSILYNEDIDGIILGTPWMFGYELTFDRSNRLINIEKDCSYTDFKIFQFLFKKSKTMTQSKIQRFRLCAQKILYLGSVITVLIIPIFKAISAKISLFWNKIKQKITELRQSLFRIRNNMEGLQNRNNQLQRNYQNPQIDQNE